MTLEKDSEGRNFRFRKTQKPVGFSRFYFLGIL
jgi:hypothetical protein